MRILLVEDEVRLAANILAGLRDSGFAVDHATDGVQGLEFAEQDLFDAIILDLMLPRKHGKSLLKTIRRCGIHTPVLILTAHNETDSVIDLLNCGADDYLAKPFKLRELVARVRALIRRARGVASPTLSVAGLDIDTVQQIVTREGRPIELSPTEFRILAYMAHKPRAVFSKKELMVHLHDYEWERHSNVIEVHMSNLRRKLTDASSESPIETLRHRGYRFRMETTA